MEPNDERMQVPNPENEADGEMHVYTEFDKVTVIPEANMELGDLFFEQNTGVFRVLIPLKPGLEGNLLGYPVEHEDVLSGTDPRLSGLVAGTILFDAGGRQIDVFFDNTLERPATQKDQMRHANSPFRIRTPERKAELLKEWFSRQLPFYNMDKHRGSLNYRIGVLQYNMLTGHYKVELEDDYRDFGWMIVVKCKLPGWQPSRKKR